MVHRGFGWDEESYGGLFSVQMVTIEVNLKEGDKEPEQHLDEGEHIQRVIVPLTELYDKLQGTSSSSRSLLALKQRPTGRNSIL